MSCSQVEIFILSHNFKMADAWRSLEKNIIAYAILCHVNYLVCVVSMNSACCVNYLVCTVSTTACFCGVIKHGGFQMTVKSNHPIAFAW